MCPGTNQQPVLQKGTADDGYEQGFKEAVLSLLPNGIEGGEFWRGETPSKEIIIKIRG
jgi:hypothetical protein